MKKIKALAQKSARIALWFNFFNGTDNTKSEPLISALERGDGV
jgi:hypothetical protein